MTFMFDSFYNKIIKFLIFKYIWFNFISKKITFLYKFFKMK